MSLDLSCDILMVESEFGVKNTKTMCIYIYIYIYIDRYGHSTTNTWPGFEESFCILRATIVVFKLICVRMQAASGFFDFDYS